MPPLGIPQLVDAVTGASSVLDAGCGSARLTLALAEASPTREVIGIDTSAERLQQGRERLAAAGPAGTRVTLQHADFDASLPFGDDRFDAVVSRLSLMIAGDPRATLGELRRVVRPGGRVATALWAPIEDNAWFGLPRAAARTVLDLERTDYARVFGRLGGEAEAAEVHQAAGLHDVDVTTARATLDVADARAHWAWMAGENGHVRRLDATLTDEERMAILAELDRLDAAHRTAAGTLALPRAMTLVTARA